MALQPKQIIDAIQALLLVNSCINLTQIFKSQTGRTEKRDKWVKIEKKKKIGGQANQEPLVSSRKTFFFFAFLLSCFLILNFLCKEKINSVIQNTIKQ